MKNTKKRVVRAWAVLGTASNKGGLAYDAFYPMIFIQKTKPKTNSGKVVPCEITYKI